MFPLFIYSVIVKRMDLEIFENKNNVLNNDFSKELEKSILKSNISYSIDRFEGEYAICENRETKEFINLSLIHISEPTRH